MIYPPIIKHGNGKSTMKLMFVAGEKTSINGGLSIATLIVRG